MLLQTHAQILLTTRIRRMGKVMFSQVYVHSHRGSSLVPGYFPGLWSQVLSQQGYPSPRYFPGLWSQVLSWGYHSPRFFPRSILGGGGTPVLASEGDTAVLARGYFSSGWDGSSVLAGEGYSLVRRQQVSLARTGLGYPPARKYWGTPSHTRQNRVSSCYAAGCQRREWL